MSNLVLIMGESGSGKSTSVKGLDPRNSSIQHFRQKIAF